MNWRGTSCILQVSLDIKCEEKIRTLKYSVPSQEESELNARNSVESFKLKVNQGSTGQPSSVSVYHGRRPLDSPVLKLHVVYVSYH